MCPSPSLPCAGTGVAPASRVDNTTGQDPDRVSMVAPTDQDPSVGLTSALCLNANPGKGLAPPSSVSTSALGQTAATASGVSILADLDSALTVVAATPSSDLSPANKHQSTNNNVGSCSIGLSKRTPTQQQPETHHKQAWIDPWRHLRSTPLARHQSLPNIANMSPGVTHLTLPHAASTTLTQSASDKMGGIDAAPPGEHPSIWSGFYKKALKERQAQLRMAFPNLFPTSLSSSLNGSGNNGYGSQSGTATPQHGSSSPVLQPRDAIPSGASSPSLTMSGNSQGATGKLMRSMQLSSAVSAGLSGSNTALDSSFGSYVEDAFPIRGLEESIADHMVENCIGTMGIPVGLALNFVIDGVPTVVPMAVEEPSVVAAVSGAAKILSASRDGIGFRTATPSRNIITAQVLLLDIPDERLAEVEETILAKKKDVIAVANQYCSNMYKRGGGVVNLLVRKVKRQADNIHSGKDTDTTAFLALHLPRSSAAATAPPSSPSTHWLVVHLHVDVCDAMGANCASTVAEGVAPVLVDLAGRGTRAGLRIVSNLNPDRLSRASFRIPVKSLAYKGFSGEQVAARVIEAYQWARDDPYRATTHNKGIMNGVDAVALATGQDWRAVEAACHSWAAGNGQTEGRGYSSLTRYWVEKEVTESGQEEWTFCGELALPIIVGTKGGVLATAPLYHYTLGMMGFPDSKRLATVMCCIGLAQNFAALRALATEGIQRGHMHLHARNIAIAAGAPTHAIPEVTAWMIEKGRISVDAAREYVTAHHLFTSLRHRLSAMAISNKSGSNVKPPSMFYFSEAHNKPLTLNIAFQTLGEKPVYIDFTEGKPASAVQSILLGGKTYEWLMRMFPLVDAIKMSSLGASPDSLRATNELTRRLKTMSLILNALLRRLMLWCPEETRSFIDKIFSHTRATTRGPGAAATTSTSPKRSASPLRLTAGGKASVAEKRPSIARHIQGILSFSARLAKHDDGSGAPIISPTATSFVAAAAAAAAAAASAVSASGNSTSPSSSMNGGAATPLDWAPSAVDWVLPDSGIFRSDLFDDELHLHDPPVPVEAQQAELPSSTSESSRGGGMLSKDQSTETLAVIPTKRQVLQVGLPLVLAVWQVFELWVTQHVASGCPLLAAAILDEQRVIVSSLVATPADVVPHVHLEQYLVVPPPTTVPTLPLTPPEAKDLFSASFHVQAKRSQCTLFLLIDLMAVEPRQVSPSTIAVVKATGWALEHEATVVHDVSRLSRDHRAVFGPGGEQGDISSDLVAVPVARSPDSPQVRFRRKSMFSAASAAAKVDPASYATPGDELVAFHADGLRNSVLLFAVLDHHIKGGQHVTRPTGDEDANDPFDLATIEACLPAYMAHADLIGLRQRMERVVATTAEAAEKHGSGMAKQRPVIAMDVESGTHMVARALKSGYLSGVSVALRSKLGVRALLDRAEKHPA